MGAIVEDGSAVHRHLRTPNVPAFQLGTTQSCFHAFDDQRAFKFGNGGDDYNHGAAQGAARVEILPEADELDIEPVQFVQDFEEVLGGTSESVAGPDQHDIEF